MCSNVPSHTVTATDYIIVDEQQKPTTRRPSSCVPRRSNALRTVSEDSRDHSWKERGQIIQVRLAIVYDDDFEADPDWKDLLIQGG
jgi:hypothetical protein